MVAPIFLQLGQLETSCSHTNNVISLVLTFMEVVSMRRLLLVFLAFFAAAGAASAQTPDTVILISIDGFRADYLDRKVTPNLNAIAKTGVLAAGMRPSFPSITFPNHYTLVTGKRPDRNGVVSNAMEDPSIPGVRLSMSNRDAVMDRRWWDEAEPIWVTAEKNNIRTATMFWPGSEAPVQGVRPQDWRIFDGSLAAERRVQTVIDWLARPVGERPKFVTLYFDDVDHAGHVYGPEAKETNKAIAKVDAAIGDLWNAIYKLNLKADVIVVSDHGMAAVDEKRTIRLDQIAPAGSYRMLYAGAYAALEPTAGQKSALANALLQPHPHMQCWPKEKIPSQFHYGRNPRVPAFICLAQTGWQILDRAPKPGFSGGAHGFDPSALEMRALFLAAGPSFLSGVKIGVFDNVDVYPLIMKLLKLQEEPNDGSLGPIRASLKP
jgi:predicted AlkP superfamily pyrophosphatase or phosphodiesterase